jgi:RimJ/RimL family protein N-acetyltransferase
MKLETPHLLLRPVTLDDVNELFAYRSDKEVNQYQGWIPETLDDVVTFIGKISSEFNTPQTWFQFMIIEKENQKIVGDLGIHFIDSGNQQTEIGCTLNKEFQRMGYATEAVTRVINFLFHDLHKHRVIASIDPGNTASIKLVERIGFRKEGHFVESLLINGKWVDDLIYALTEKDWGNMISSDDFRKDF